MNLSQKSVRVKSLILKNIFFMIFFLKMFPYSRLYSCIVGEFTSIQVYIHMTPESTMWITQRVVPSESIHLNQREKSTII